MIIPIAQSTGSGLSNPSKNFPQLHTWRGTQKILQTNVEQLFLLNARVGLLPSTGERGGDRFRHNCI